MVLESSQIAMDSGKLNVYRHHKANRKFLLIFCNTYDDYDNLPGLNFTFKIDTYC